MKKKCILFWITLCTISGFSQDANGTWNGAIELNDERKIHFIFNIEKNGTAYKTVIDIPTQRVNGIKANNTLVKKDSLIIDLSNVGMYYRGKLNAAHTNIIGKIEEGPNSFVLNLSKNGFTDTIQIRRPQEPKKPYPYIEEDVSFTNTKANVTLAGTLTMPKEKKRHPVVVLISGSGPQDRDETISQHKPFWILADYLTRNGIAVLRYDDRGFGKSSGNHADATTYDFATDVISAIDYLKKRSDIDPGSIGLIGHSEGAIIAPLAANETNEVAFIISLAGTGISGTELSVIQSKSLRPFPVPDEAAYERAIRRAIEIAKQDKEISIIKPELKKHYFETIAPILKNLGVPDPEIDRIIDGLVDVRTTKWIRYFYGYNPAEEYQKVTCPVLSLNGNLDTQVEAKINQQGLRNALTKGMNDDFEIIELEGLNHLFQNATTGKMEEYSEIEETFSPKALAIINNWIKKHI